MEITVELTGKEVEAAIKIYLREMILGSASPLAVTEIRRKDHYSDTYMASLVYVDMVENQPVERKVAP